MSPPKFATQSFIAITWCNDHLDHPMTLRVREDARSEVHPNGGGSRPVEGVLVMVCTRSSWVRHRGRRGVTPRRCAGRVTADAAEGAHPWAVGRSPVLLEPGRHLAQLVAPPVPFHGGRLRFVRGGEPAAGQVLPRVRSGPRRDRTAHGDPQDGHRPVLRRDRVHRARRTAGRGGHALRDGPVLRRHEPGGGARRHGREACALCAPRPGCRTPSKP